ncbi:MAG: 23S rRNA (adenine(2030)-N(6))-methyltransferase RlmJ, partial [Steroidobacteraceae bacterium]
VRVTNYRHAFHAGNFADLHKHTALVALLEALQRKEKGFLYLDTHAGRGAYDLARSPEGRTTAPALDRILAGGETPSELARYARAIAEWRKLSANARGYAGSPVIAASVLRPQDRAVLIEREPEEAQALAAALTPRCGVSVVEADGLERLRAYLPPPERRGLTLIDPPYEAEGELQRVESAVAEALRRFATGVVAVWYPIKQASDTAQWHARMRQRLAHEILLSELWIHPCDSRVALNGSGLLIVNPPYRIGERMRAWLPALLAALDAQRSGGTRVEMLV